MKKIALTIAIILLQLAASAAELKSVIVISPYQMSDAWSQSSLSPITDLEASHPELVVNNYTLDISIHNTPELYNEFIQNVIAHTQGKRPDLVVIQGSQSFCSIETFNKSWPGVRMVVTGDLDYVCDVDYVLAKYPDPDAARTPLSSYLPKANLTLVQTPLYYEETMDLISAMKPYLKEVIFIGGEDFYSREAQVNMKSVVEGRGFTYTTVTPFDMHFDEFTKMVAGRDPFDTAILFKSCYVSENREYFRNNIENAMPVFYMHYMQKRGHHGGIGYVSYRFSDYESVLQKTISDILFEDVEPSEIPFTAVKSNGPTVNVDAVDHFSMHRHLIPKDAELINVPPTFWEKYHNFVILTILMSFALVLFIVMLISSRKRRKELEKTRAELEAANSKLAEAKDKAIHASALKSLYVQNMGHDVRTPINAIVGFSQLLGLPEGMLSDTEKDEYNRYIANNSEMLMLLVEDILNMSDLENNGYKINISEASCNEMGEASVSCVKMRASAGVNLYYTSEVDDSYKIRTDRRRVQQILTNYLTNACKHTEQGEIEVHCSISEEPGKVVFSVRDTGHGIDPDMADCIFERYRKLDNIEGHGIGLNICLTIAEKMGCEVKLDTTYKNGARFLLIIPITQQ